MGSLTNYVKNKSLWFYIAVYLLFIYIFISALGFNVETITNPIIGVMYFIEFGIHEASHIVFAFLPQILVAAAGSGGEILFTVLVVIAALKYKSYFTAIFGSLWFMLACRSTGNYMSDARSQLLPLIGPGGENTQHDWHFVFSQVGWLAQDHLIGGIVTAIGIIIGLLALLFGILILIFMASTPKSVIET
jgi:hypothetical protein